MAVARCSGCREYFRKEEMFRTGVSSVCSQDCLSTVSNRRKRATKRVKKVQRRTSISRAWIRDRDNNRCRYCSRADVRLSVHHIEYRSQGGKDTNHNLITLCDEHHRLVHSKKWKYQPILRGVIWVLLAEGREITVPEFERVLWPAYAHANDLPLN